MAIRACHCRTKEQVASKKCAAQFGRVCMLPKFNHALRLVKRQNGWLASSRSCTAEPSLGRGILQHTADLGAASLCISLKP